MLDHTFYEGTKHLKDVSKGIGTCFQCWTEQGPVPCQPEVSIFHHATKLTVFIRQILSLFARHWIYLF